MANMKNGHNAKKGVSVFGIPYARLLVDTITYKEAKELKRYFSYIAIYSYTKIDLPGFIHRTQKTSCIDLSQNIDSIFNTFRRDVRNGIRKTESIKEMHFAVPADDAKTSYNFYRKIKRIDGVVPDMEQEFVGCLFFNAYLGNELLVSMSFYDNGTVLRSKHIVSRRKEKGMARMSADATRRLMWEICKYAKKKGYRMIDLGGVDTADPAKKGIAEFKLSFGGGIRGVYIYRYQSFLFRVVKKLLGIFGKNIH